MPLSDFPVRASVAVADIARAVEFYEGRLGLPLVRSGPSAAIVEGGRLYASAGGPALNVYQSPTAGKSEATTATWNVDDLDALVTELIAAGVVFARYDGFGQDERGIGPRAGGGRIAWFRDPDGNTFAIESDT